MKSRSKAYVLGLGMMDGALYRGLAWEFLKKPCLRLHIPFTLIHIKKCMKWRRIIQPWKVRTEQRLSRSVLSGMSCRCHKEWRSGNFPGGGNPLPAWKGARKAACSCSTMAEGAFSSIAGTTYPSTDEDIHETENVYAALEEALNRQVNNMESTHPGYDEYWYQIDEISHTPYHLISYFSAKYGEFTFGQVADEVEEIFQEQYRLFVDEVRDMVTETKTVRVGESLGQVVTSGYCSCPVCCGSWSGGPTASGVYPTASHTIAVDTANPFVPMGTKVVMNGVEYVVEDTGAFASYRVQFDVYYDNHATASAHGHQTWEAYIADSNGSQEVEVTTTEVVNRLEVKLENHGLDAVLRSRMDADEEKRYDLYNAAYGNRNDLFNVGSLPGGADGFGYEIPAEVLSDEKFANMIHEAEKYLGYPYVWGGASPSTSFDCSGFVSWVVNHCGNGWNVGRKTAEGLRGCCAYVSPAQAKPGDLIFF